MSESRIGDHLASSRHPTPTRPVGRIGIRNHQPGSRRPPRGEDGVFGMHRSWNAKACSHGYCTPIFRSFSPTHNLNTPPIITSFSTRLPSWQANSLLESNNRRSPPSGLEDKQPLNLPSRTSVTEEAATFRLISPCSMPRQYPSLSPYIRSRPAAESGGGTNSMIP